MKRTARLKITVADLHRLWKALCKHKEKYKVPTNPYDWNWADCDECVLRKIPWPVPDTDGIIRDFCFAIWHEDIIDKKARKRR